MRKYKAILAFLILILTAGLTVNIQADVGPKPTSTITISGVEEPYYFDVLYETNNQLSILTPEEIEDQIEYYYYRDDFPSILNGYKDSDNFVSYSLYEDIPHTITNPEDNVFKLGYFSPPSVFKAVVVTESGNMFVSDIVNKTFFDAEFTWDLSDVNISNPDSQVTLNAGNIHENIPRVTGFLSTISISIVITVALELGVLFIFGYRQKQSYMTALIINIITQLILFTAIYTTNLFMSIYGGILALLLGELFVFIFEIIYYSKKLTEHSRGKAIGYGFLANLVSLILGTYILSLITNIL